MQPENYKKTKQNIRPKAVNLIIRVVLRTTRQFETRDENEHSAYLRMLSQVPIELYPLVYWTRFVPYGPYVEELKTIRLEKG
jgi:hypothetical protein